MEKFSLVESSFGDCDGDGNGCGDGYRLLFPV